MQAFEIAKVRQSELLSYRAGIRPPTAFGRAFSVAKCGAAASFIRKCGAGLFRQSVAYFLNADGSGRLCVWWAVPTAVKSHVVKRPIRRSASRRPDDKAAYDRNGSPKQDGIFAHVKIQLATS